MVVNVCTTDYVALDRANAIGFQRNRAIIEQYVVVWAEDDDIFRYVWPVVRLTERLYVMGFGVGFSIL